MTADLHTASYGLRAHSIAVVIPAHNEQARLASCLASVHKAAVHLDRVAPHVRVRVMVVLDACTDGTAGIVAEAAGVDSVSVGFRSVGAARRAGVGAVLADCGGPLDGLWLASTDADCTVPEGWLATFVGAADDGYQLVLGMVRPDDALSAPARRAWNRRHRFEDGHPHVHGANLAVRADLYCRVGGWGSVETGEDVDLVARTESVGSAAVLRTRRHPVVTSSRLAGRAPSGFADYLLSLGAASESP
ncbi:MAG: glycosyltransferase [Actinomycetota bacterium]|nr:glycosyltransferase [Actinomycetota bacterium]